MTNHLIQRLGHKGDGIAEGPIFAPLTLPGETVTGELEGDRLSKVRVLSPSEHRVSAPCRHFKQCGGCALQHASDSFLEQWKSDIVASALTAQGLDAPIRSIHVSPPETRRRAVFTARRTKSSVLVGFHARASDIVVDTPQCHLLLPELLSARTAIAEFAQFGATRKHGLTANATRTLGGVDLSITSAKTPEPAELGALIAIGQRHNLARLSWNQDVLAEYQKPEQMFGKARVVPPPGSFLQATENGEQALVSAVLETVFGNSKVVDLFSGCGTFSLPAAEHADVHAVESQADMLKALDSGWRNAVGLKAVTTQARDLFRRPLHSTELNTFDAAIIDPPRAGAEAQFSEIAASKLSSVAAVSCNPITFARDAKRLVAAGFRLNWIDVVDQFRWSPHIELAASFSR